MKKYFLLTATLMAWTAVSIKNPRDPNIQHDVTALKNNLIKYRPEKYVPSNFEDDAKSCRSRIVFCQLNGWDDGVGLEVNQKKTWLGCRLWGEFKDFADEMCANFPQSGTKKEIQTRDYYTRYDEAMFYETYPNSAYYDARISTLTGM